MESRANAYTHKRERESGVYMIVVQSNKSVYIPFKQDGVNVKSPVGLTVLN